MTRPWFSGLLLIGSAAASGQSRKRGAFCESTACGEQEEASLLQRHSDTVRKPRAHPAAFFGGFSVDESTFTEDGLADGVPQDAWGWDPAGGELSGGLPSAAFFHESPSGPAEDRAWQTHSPELTTKWEGPPWAEPFVRPQRRPGPHQGDWFESAVGQEDRFGRPKAPGPLRGWREWERRSVSGLLNCSAPGCKAQLRLQAFEAHERGRKCSLGLQVRATDFDDPDEQAIFVVNGQEFKTECAGVGACSSELQHCFEEPLEMLMDASGILNIEGRITKNVDECPHEGNLLDAVATVTCSVAPKDPAPLFGTLGNDPRAQLTEAALGTRIVADGSMVAFHEWDHSDLSTLRSGVMHAAAREIEGSGWRWIQAPLKCANKGCRANLELTVHRAASVSPFCSLSVLVNQTDFDGEFGSNESIVLFVGGREVAIPALPKRNPCEAELAPATDAIDKEVLLVRNLDVSHMASSGRVLIDVGISKSVDDCPSQTFLFDGLVQLNCSLP